MVRVRAARTMDELQIVSQLQAEIWGSQSVAAPASILRAITQAGGLALLAWSDGRPLGFTYGFIGRSPEGAVYHRSHSAGVLPAFRDLGVGRMLKLAQRQAVLASGLDRIVWTFDPTQVRNAHFNLHRLGATVRGFRRDYYGDRDDALNRSGPTDRLFVEWLLAAPQLAELARLRRLQPRGWVRLPAGLPAEPDGDRQVARRLQARLRRGLEGALRSGLQIIDFDAESRSYRLAELPSWFPIPAEGRVPSSRPAGSLSGISASESESRRSTSSSPP
jgi:predicted GNAT superfamily acetyltransferase